MIVKYRYIIEHKSGHFVTAKYEPVNDIDRAVRFMTREEAEYFFAGSYYRTDKPEDYRVRVIKIVEELESEEDVQEERNDRAAG